MEGAATLFGKVGFTIRSRADEGKMTVQIDPPTRQAPKFIKIRLRHPRRAKIKAVEINGQRHRHAGGALLCRARAVGGLRRGFLVCPCGRGRARIA